MRTAQHTLCGACFLRKMSFFKILHNDPLSYHAISEAAQAHYPEHAPRSRALQARPATCTGLHSIETSAQYQDASFRGVVDFIRSAAVARYPAREKLYDVVLSSLVAIWDVGARVMGRSPPYCLREQLAPKPANISVPCSACCLRGCADSAGEPFPEAKCVLCAWQTVDMLAAQQA